MNVLKRLLLTVPLVLNIFIFNNELSIHLLQWKHIVEVF